MTVPSLFASLREDLALEVKYYHPAAQAGRFLALFAVTLALQVLSGASVTGWAALRSLLAGAAAVAFRQWRKTMPVPTVQRVVDEHEQALADRPHGP